MFCSRCGRHNPPNAVYCAFCAAKMGAPEASATPPAPAMASEPQPSQAPRAEQSPPSRLYLLVGAIIAACLAIPIVVVLVGYLVFLRPKTPSPPMGPDEMQELMMEGMEGPMMAPPGPAHARAVEPQDEPTAAAQASFQSGLPVFLWSPEPARVARAECETTVYTVRYLADPNAASQPTILVVDKVGADGARKSMLMLDQPSVDWAAGRGELSVEVGPTILLPGEEDVTPKWVGLRVERLVKEDGATVIHGGEVLSNDVCIPVD
jgi:hypothetical protein